MTLTTTPMAYTVPPPSLQQDFWSLAQYLTMDHCICFHQSLGENSLMANMVVINLIKGDSKFRHPVGYFVCILINNDCLKFRK